MMMQFIGINDGFNAEDEEKKTPKSTSCVDARLSNESVVCWAYAHGIPKIFF